MKVKFGLKSREISVDIDEDTDTKDFIGKVESAVASQKVKLFWVKDRSGKNIGIVTEKLTYVEISPQAGDSQIGFGSA